MDWQRPLFVTSLVLSTVAFSSFASAEDGVTPTEVMIGVANPLTGKVTSGIPINAGFTAALSRLNAGNGIHGRKIKIVHCDDEYSPEKTVSCTKKLMTEDKVFALTGYNGTATIKAAYPMIAKGTTPFLFGRTGDNFLREQNKLVFNMRPSFDDEIDSVVKELIAKGASRFALLRQADAYGDSIKSGLIKSLKAAGKLKDNQPLVAEGMVQRDKQDPTEVLSAIEAGNPDVVIIGTAPPAAAELVKVAAEKKKKWIFAGTSNASNIAALAGDTPIEIVLSQVVPLPESNEPIANEYREDMKKAGQEKDISIISFESYMNMRMIGEALKRAGNNPTRQSFIAALEAQPVDLGGFKVDFHPTNHNGKTKILLSRVKNKKVVAY